MLLVCCMCMRVHHDGEPQSTEAAESGRGNVGGSVGVLCCGDALGLTGTGPPSR